MKIKYSIGMGGAVVTYTNDRATIEEAVNLLSSKDVISITVIKQTPTEYLKSQRPPSEALSDGEINR